MPIVVLKLPDVKRKTEGRPKKCPYCGGETFQRWGRVKKSVKDLRVRSIRVYRYRCCHCQRTFRHYPEGNTQADQTGRLHVFAVMCWRLGLSHRGVSTILSGLKVSFSHMTSWRDVQTEAERTRKQNQGKPVRIVGLDAAYVLGWGAKRSVLVAVDLGNGQPMALGYVNESDPHAVRRWLEPLVQEHGISVIVTDDLSSYRLAARKLHLEHQVCQFHVRRWVGRALRELQETIPKEWRWVLEEIKQLLEALPPFGDRRLYALWEQLAHHRSKRMQKLRELLLRLSQHWQSYVTHQFEPDVPWTNNATERAIGKMKMRARTVRGYKSWPGMHSGLLLAGTCTP